MLVPPDTTAPVITLTGDSTVNVELGSGTYTDAGATTDDGVTSVVTTGTVDTNTAGTYTITYSATDAAGNSATQVTRTVVVAAGTTPDVFHYCPTDSHDTTRVFNNDSDALVPSLSSRANTLCLCFVFNSI